MTRWLLAAALVAAFSCQAAAQSWTQPGTATGTGYPAGAQPFIATATGTTSATVTITPPTGRTVYVCGISAAALAGTGQTAVGTVTNLLGPAGTAVTFSFLLAGSMAAAAATAFNEDITPCIAAVAGQNVVVTTPTSTAATNSTLAVMGYFF